MQRLLICELSAAVFIVRNLEGFRQALRNVQRVTIQYLVRTKTFGTFDRCLRKRAIEHIFSLLGFLVRQEAEARAVFVEALVQPVLFIPAILVVVDIMVRLWICEM